MWYQRDLELTPKSDRLGRGKTMGQLGQVAYERFQESRRAGEPEAVLREHLNAARERCQEALQMFPPNAVNDLATCHGALGNIYRNAGQTKQSIAHYSEALRYDEQAGNLYSAAWTRENMARAYAQAGRFDLALLFARAALANYEQFGPPAAAEAEEAQGLITAIEEAAQGGT